MTYLDLANWKTATGWCVDADGKEDGRGNTTKGFTKETCFALCEKSFDFNGCTFDLTDASGKCITYTGDIVGGNNNAAYECFYRSGTQMNFRKIKLFDF